MLRVSSDWEAMPGLQTIVALCANLGRLAGITSSNNRTPRISDFGDILHSLYYPYVDVFRADAFMASVIKEAKFRSDTDVVGKFRGLPAHIEECLKAK
jgi:hypothetical protein